MAFTEFSFDLTQLNYKFNPSQTYKIRLNQYGFKDDFNTPNLPLDFYTFNANPVNLAVTRGAYNPNEMAITLDFSRIVNYNEGNIYLTGSDSTILQTWSAAELTPYNGTTQFILNIDDPFNKLEDNADYLIELEDDLFITPDRILVKATDFQFVTVDDGLDDFVAFLPPAIASINLDYIRYRDTNTSMRASLVSTAVPYLYKSFDESTEQKNPRQGAFSGNNFFGEIVATNNLYWFTSSRYGSNGNYQDALVIGGYPPTQTTRFFNTELTIGLQANNTFFTKSTNSGTIIYRGLGYLPNLAPLNSTPINGGVYTALSDYDVFIAGDPFYNSNTGRIFVYKYDPTANQFTQRSIINGITTNSYIGRYMDCTDDYVVVLNNNNLKIEIYDIQGNLYNTISLDNVNYSSISIHGDSVYVCRANTNIKGYNIHSGNEILSMAAGSTVKVNELYVMTNSTDILRLYYRDSGILYKTITNPLAGSQNNSFATSNNGNGFAMSSDATKLIIGAKNQNERVNDLPYTAVGAIYTYK